MNAQQLIIRRLEKNTCQLCTVQADALEWATVLIPGDQDAHEGRASSHLVRTYLFKWGGDESCLVKIYNFFFFAIPYK